MGDEHVQPAADNYVQAQDQNGDYHGQNFNGGVTGVVNGDGGVTVGPTQPGGPSPVQGQISQNVKSATTGEDPMFTAMAGDSKEFVGGIPKEKWDSMSPEARKELSQIGKPMQSIIKGTASGIVGIPVGVAGAAVGTAAGATAGAIWNGPAGALLGAGTGALAGGIFGGNFGGQIGSDIADHYIQEYNNSPPPPTTLTREQLRQEYEYAKERD